MFGIKIKGNQLIIPVRIIPKSSRNQVIMEGDRIKIKITAPPVEGKANQGLIKFLSKLLGVSKSSIEIISGETSKNKKVSVIGMTENEFINRIKK